jgi:hypothetical protein
MTRKPDRDERESDVLSRTAPHVTGPPVDETQSTRQGATAPQPKVGFDDELDDVTGEELDEAWAGLTLALKAADEDFDAAAAYLRLSRSLPADLVAMPLVERAAAVDAGGARRELRNLALGLVAMGAVCAGLAGIAFFGPGLEKLSRPEQEVAERPIEASQVSEPSPGAGEVWNDRRWEEDLLAFAHELESERRRLRDLDRDSFERPRDGIARLEHDFARAMQEFGDRAEF